MTTPPAEDTYFTRLYDPRVRGYLVAVGASLAVVFVALFQRGQPLAAALPFALALPGLFLRWTAMPTLVVAAVCYLLVFPSGVPLDGLAYANVRTSYFEATDLLFVAAVLCYLAAQHRLYGLTLRAVPDDRPKHLRKRTDPQPRRPANAIRPTEMHWLFAGVGAAVLGGQLLWLGLTTLDLDAVDFPHVRRAARGLATRESRFVLFMTGAVVVGIAARLLFWYWRLSAFNRDEARLTLVDTGWSEVRREAARQETWRAWGRPGARPRGGSIRGWLWAVFPVVTAVVLAAVGISLVLWVLWMAFTLN